MGLKYRFSEATLDQEFPDLAAATALYRDVLGAQVSEPVPQPAHAAASAPQPAPLRCGSVPEIQPLIGQIVVDDLEAILAGLPPQRCQRAVLETVTRLRSKPVGAWSLSDTRRP